MATRRRAAFDGDIDSAMGSRRTRSYNVGPSNEDGMGEINSEDGMKPGGKESDDKVVTTARRRVAFDGEVDSSMGAMGSRRTRSYNVGPSDEDGMGAQNSEDGIKVGGMDSDDKPTTRRRVAFDGDGDSAMGAMGSRRTRSYNVGPSDENGIGNSENRKKRGGKDADDKDSDAESDSHDWTTSLKEKAHLCGQKLMSKKFAVTSRFVVSSHKWMKTIPTKNCDVILTFPAGFKDEETMLWLLSRLRTRVPELCVRVRYHVASDVYNFYLTATYENMLRGAEEMGIRKEISPQFGGGVKEFVFEDQDFFEGVEDAATFLTSQERQSIIQQMLMNLRGQGGDELQDIKFFEGQAIVPTLVSRKIIDQVFPLHSTTDLEELRDNWVQAFFKEQPLDQVCEYFSVKIALYFGFLGYYTKCLFGPAFLGLFFWLVQGTHQDIEDVCFVVFALFNVLWATLYLEMWKRKSAEYAYRWGTLDKQDELLVEPRPLFHGRIGLSLVTGRLEPMYPTWKRNMFRYLVSCPVIAFCLFVVFATMWCIFELQNWINRMVDNFTLPFFFRFIPKVLLAISIGVFDDIYKKIATWLNDKGFNITVTILLAFFSLRFQFVNSFLSLFYIAFYIQDMQQLKDQLAALLITRQVIGNIKEAVLPFILERIKMYKHSYSKAEAMSPDTLERQIKRAESGEDIEEEGEGVERSSVSPERSSSSPEESVLDSDPELTEEKKKFFEDLVEKIDSGLNLTQSEVEASMTRYEDTFEDYLEMLIQFGYVTLFSPAFPMAAMCAMINNIIEIRSDAFKLCVTSQRPFGQRVENIGIWQHALELMSIIAVMVNCALIGMSDLADRLFAGCSTAQRIVIIVLLEHIVLALKLLVANAIPDIPTLVAESKARLEFLRREALKELTALSRMKPNKPEISDESNTSNLPNGCSANPAASSSTNIDSGNALNVEASATTSTNTQVNNSFTHSGNTRPTNHHKMAATIPGRRIYTSTLKVSNLSCPAAPSTTATTAATSSNNVTATTSSTRTTTRTAQSGDSKPEPGGAVRPTRLDAYESYSKSSHDSAVSPPSYSSVSSSPLKKSSSSSSGTSV